MTSKRLDHFGKINRKKAVSFTWENKKYFGFEGDSLASALLANNIKAVGRSFKYHRPRGIMSCGVEESGALVTVGQGNRRDPNVRATTQELYEGLVDSGQNAFPSVNFDFGSINDFLSPFLFMYSMPFTFFPSIINLSTVTLISLLKFSLSNAGCR